VDVGEPDLDVFLSPFVDSPGDDAHNLVDVHGYRLTYDYIFNN
jgi:hypothetical protein